MYSPSRTLALFCMLAACGTTTSTPVASPSLTSAAGAPRPAVRGAPAAPASAVQRTLVAREDIAEMPGFESRMYLIDYPPSARADLHVHTKQCVGYVLEGRFESSFADGPVTVTHAGEGFVEIPGEPHRFRNPDPQRPLRFVLAGTFRKDEPLFQAVPGGAEPSFAHDAPSSGGLASASSAPPGPGEPVKEVKRALLAQRDAPEWPGMESRIYLIEFPPAAESKVHVHSVQGIGYVLEGSFESSFGGGTVTVKRAGEGFVDAPGLPHHFRNPDPARPLRFVFAGTFPKGAPIFQVVAP